MRPFVLLLTIVVVVRLPACKAQNPTEQSVATVRTKLSKGESTVSDILTNASLLPLHPLPAFRQIIREHAKAEKITIVTAQEPGTKINVKIKLLKTDGSPLTGTLVYLYQTDSKGWYADTSAHVQRMEGDRNHARLFGYVKTDSAGSLELETIQPQEYPQSTLPAHIHIEVFEGEKALLISEVLFDDDPRLTSGIREEAKRQHYPISKNTATSGQPMYDYTFQLR